GVQLTWMDAKVDDWVVTPRTGKAVEINALWYNALRTMALFAKRLRKPSKHWDEAAARVAAGFELFWHERAGCCYDVIDGPGGADDALRPNQIFVVSLPESPLSRVRQKRVVDACARHLLTSYGLRSLAPGHPQYQGRYGGDPWRRDGAYHQGTVWAWLLGPFALAHFRVYRDGAAARSFLEPFAHHLSDYGVGSIAEIFDGDAPCAPRGCIAADVDAPRRPRGHGPGDARGVGGGRQGAPLVGARRDALVGRRRGELARLARDRRGAARAARASAPRRRGRADGRLHRRAAARHGRLEPLPRGAQGNLREDRRVPRAPRARLDRSRSGPGLRA
ncbi:MAG: hypothetical protein HYU25_12780, partial [Candidatus Rokubacteria bacterium]|nr:hypothetical protein [Candidatus Rokubacteria bacterium]